MTYHSTRKPRLKIDSKKMHNLKDLKIYVLSRNHWAGGSQTTVKGRQDVLRDGVI